MHYLLAVVEGKTEESIISSFVRSKVGQSPKGYGKIEVVSILTHGNQGYTGLVDMAEKCIDDYLRNPDNCYSEEDDSYEKWLVFDYDDIDSKKITLDELKRRAESAGFKCIISKPNIEYFILSLLGNYEFANSVNPSNYMQKIKDLIDDLNEKDLLDKTGFTDALKIPPYSKRAYWCKNCLFAIFSLHPELIDRILDSKSSHTSRYSEIPTLLNRILELLKVE